MKRAIYEHYGNKSEFLLVLDIVLGENNKLPNAKVLQNLCYVMINCLLLK